MGIEVVDSEQKFREKSEGGGRRARPHARDARQDQRPGAHVPARDGHGAAADARGRGRDRQAHRARKERDAARDLAHQHGGAGGGAARRAARRPRDRRARRGGLQRRGGHRGEARGQDQGDAEADRQGQRRPPGVPGLPQALREAREEVAHLRQGQVAPGAASDPHVALDPPHRLRRGLQAPAGRARARGGRPDPRRRGPHRAARAQAQARRERRLPQAGPADGAGPEDAARPDPGGVRRTARGDQALARHRDHGRGAGRAGARRSWSRRTCGWWSPSPRSTRTAGCSSWT